MKGIYNIFKASTAIIALGKPLLGYLQRFKVFYKYNYGWESPYFEGGTSVKEAVQKVLNQHPVCHSYVEGVS
ncbi:hypothetical protein [Flavobacterium covae]